VSGIIQRPNCAAVPLRNYSPELDQSLTVASHWECDARFTDVISWWSTLYCHWKSGQRTASALSNYLNLLLSRIGVFSWWQSVSDYAVTARVWSKARVTFSDPLTVVLGQSRVLIW